MSKKTIHVTSENSIQGIRASVPFNSLKISPYNVRKKQPSVQSIYEFADNIAEVGLLQNLIVHTGHEGKGKSKQEYNYIVGGGRRYRALELLLEQGRIKEDEIIDVLIVPESEAIKISLSENINQEKMHISDQLRAFSCLAEKGSTVSQIASMFGYKIKHIQRALKLAEMSPVLLDLLSEDQISVEQLQILAICEDHNKQVEIWNNAGVWDRQPAGLKKLVTKQNVSLKNDNLAQFVGIDTYKDAGGSVVYDLFSEEDDLFLSDYPLLKKLANEKLHQISDEIVAKENWAFSKVFNNWNDYYYGGKIEYQIISATPLRELTTEEQQNIDDLNKQIELIQSEIDCYDDSDSNIDELENKLELLELKKKEIIESINGWNDEDKKNCGVLVYLSDDEVIIIRGARAKKDNIVSIDNNNTSETEKKERPLHSATLIQNLTAHRSVAVQLEVSKNTNIALILLTHNLVCTVFNGYHSSVLNISSHDCRQRLLSLAPNLENSDSFKQLNAKYDDWERKLPDDFENSMNWLLDWDINDVTALLSFCIALSIDGSTINEPVEKSRLIMIENVLPNFNINNHWKATADTYFNFINKDNLIKTISENISHEASFNIVNMKKKDGATHAEFLFKDLNWTPNLMKV